MLSKLWMSEVMELRRGLVAGVVASLVVTRTEMESILGDRSRMEEVEREVERMRRFMFVKGMGYGGKVEEWPISVRFRDGERFEGVVLRSECEKIEDWYVNKVARELEAYLEFLTSK